MRKFEVGIRCSAVTDASLTRVIREATSAKGRVIGVSTGAEDKVAYPQPHYVVELFNESTKVAEFWDPIYWVELL